MEKTKAGQAARRPWTRAENPLMDYRTTGDWLPTWKQASALNAGAIGYVFDDPGNAIQRWDRRHACLNYSLLLFNWTPKRGH